MRHEDRLAWIEMRAQLWDDATSDDHQRDINKMLAGGRSTGYIAETDNARAVGFAEICIRDFANGCSSQPVPFLEGIWVHPIYRGHGIGRALVDQIVMDLESQGFTEFGSDAQLENVSSHAAHQRWGFIETERVVYFRRPIGTQNPCD